MFEISYDEQGNMLVDVDTTLDFTKLLTATRDLPLGEIEEWVFDEISNEYGVLYRIWPDEVGALTDAFFFSTGVTYDDEGDVVIPKHCKLYSDINYYQIRSFVDDLKEIGRCRFELIK